MRLNKFYLLVAVVLLLIATLLTSCSTDQITPEGKLEKQYFVDVGGAVLPVMVAGKNTSDVAIIFVHGGPGNSSQLYRKYKGLFRLESEYKMIYYDQRASGITQGNSSAEELTIKRFSDDLDVIVDFTKEIVGARKIYLIGHSWGGGLTTYYLLDQEHEDKIQGWIPVAPGFNIVQGMINSRNWAITVATANILLNNNKNYWERAQTWYDNHPVITQDIFFDHAKYIDRADGTRFSRAEEVEVDLPDYQIHAFQENFFFTQARMKVDGELIFDALALDDEMYQITLPTILMWGERDGLLPVVQKDDFINSIGTPDGQLWYWEFTASAHEPMSEQGDEFAEKVYTFVEFTR